MQHTAERRQTTSATQSAARLIQLFAQAFLLQASGELCKAQALQRNSEGKPLSHTGRASLHYSPYVASAPVKPFRAGAQGKKVR